MKITSYKGAVYRVPFWVGYIAADEDGMVMGHEDYPQKWAHEWAPQKGARWKVLMDGDRISNDKWGDPKRI